MRIKITIGVVTVLLVGILGACGDDESTDGTVQADRSTTTEDAGSTTTTGADDDATTTTSGSSAPSEAFCDDLLAFLNMQSDGVFSEEQATAAQQLADTAPAEVQPQLVIIRDGIVGVVELDPPEDQDAFVALAQDQQYLGAIQEVYRWGPANCASAG
jgi:hypothetical protein